MFKDPKEQQELEQIVEEALEEVKQDEDIEKDYEAFKNLPKKDTEVSNCELQKRLIKLDESMLELNKTVHKGQKEDRDLSVELLKEAHYIKKYQGKYNFVNMGIVAFSFFIMGITYERWSPFAWVLWELFKFGK